MKILISAFTEVQGRSNERMNNICERTCTRQSPAHKALLQSTSFLQSPLQSVPPFTSLQSLTETFGVLGTLLDARTLRHKVPVLRELTI